MNISSQTIIDFIKSRRSIGNLNAPAPSMAEVQTALTTACCAPDHKQLRPYRFIILEQDDLATLGTALRQASIAEGETDEKSLAKAEAMPKRAPMIIVCVTDYKFHPKVPKSEQLLAAGAAVQNLLLALQAMGYASVWRTGPLVYTQTIRQRFGLADDNQVVGFIYVGTAGTSLPEHDTSGINACITYGFPQ